MVYGPWYVVHGIWSMVPLKVNIFLPNVRKQPSAQHHVPEDWNCAMKEPAVPICTVPGCLVSYPTFCCILLSL